MLTLSRKDIESISRKILSEYLKLVDKRLNRIDPIDFAEKMCGIRFEFTDLRSDGRLLGVTSYGEIEINIPSGNGERRCLMLDGRTAYIDQSLVDEGNTGRLNFTMMHEAAHQMLGILFPNEYNFEKQPVICRFAEERCSRPITNWSEWQTNVLASSLLLPRELVKKKLFQFGMGEKIRLLNRVYASKEYMQFSALAEYLGVSKTA